MFYGIGLGGEVGEALNIIKKLVRDKNNKMNHEMRSSLISEYGDIMWYLLGSMESFDISLQDIINDNVRKIRLRNA